MIQNIIITLVVLAQILSVVYVYVLVANKSDSKIGVFLAKKGFILAFIVALVSMCGSLYYSDVLGYEPCKMCWYQRICMYPEVLLLGLALYRRDTAIYFYARALAIAGGFLALNHYILQMTGSSILPCSAVGYSVSCSKVFVMNLGYITIPLMALSGFVLIILSLTLWHKHNKQITN